MNMNERLEDFVEKMGMRLGFMWDTTASLTWSGNFGPTVQRVEKEGETKMGDFYLTNGLLHSDHCGHKATFTISVPGQHPDGFIMNWLKIEITNLDWNGYWITHDDPTYSLPELSSKYNKMEFREGLKLAETSAQIIVDFDMVLEDVKASCVG
jgi:hypothetical protein